MPEVPVFACVGEFRCWERNPDADRVICAAPASWMRSTPISLSYGLFCDTHRRDGDRAIGGELTIRRVSLALEVIFCATSLNSTFAQIEALETLTRAVESVGGVVNLHAARSQVGRFRVHPAHLPARGELYRG